MNTNNTIGEKIHLKHKICVFGAAESSHCAEDALRKAEEIGKEIAQKNCVLICGAESGIPLWAAKGTKEAGGITVGLSPAFSEVEHISQYKLPIENFDLIIYTGFQRSGRNLFLVRAADAVVIICGRLGTLNEFTIAFEDNMPIGVLTGTGGTADLIQEIVEKGHRGEGRIVYDSDPKKLLEKLIKMVEEDKKVVEKTAQK